MTSIRNAPSAGRGLGLATWREFRHDTLDFLCRTAQAHGDVVRWHIGPKPIYLLCSPEAVQRVLVEHSRNYDKKTRGYDALRLFLGADRSGGGIGGAFIWSERGSPAWPTR
jgi:hypothetical protein